MAAVAARSFWTNPDPDDPLSKALQPPIDETPEERTARIRELDEAARAKLERANQKIVGAGRGKRKA